MSGLFSAKEPQKSNVTQVTACKNLAFNTRSLISGCKNISYRNFLVVFIEMNIFTFFDDSSNNCTCTVHKLEQVHRDQ